MSAHSIACGNCQSELPLDAVFCFVCGQQVAGEATCPGCHAGNPAGSQFCLQCGKQLPAPGQGDPLSEMQEDLSLAGRKLDLAEEQNRLNARELNLYTDEKRASKQAESQQKLDAAKFEQETEFQIQNLQREGEHRSTLDETQRRDEADRQQEQFTAEREDRATTRQHSRKLESWEHKKAELDKEMLYKRRLLENSQELDEKQRAWKIKQLEEQHRVTLDKARRDLEARNELAAKEQDGRLQRSEREFDHALRQKQTETQFQRETVRGQRSDDLDHDRARGELEHERDARELKLAMDAQKQLLEWKQSSKDAENRRELDKLRGEQETMTAAERARHDMNLERMGKLNELNPEALIASAPEEQARLLAELRQTEALKGFSEEQILARAAERSPAVAAAIAEKYKSAGSQAAKDEMKELYERMFVSHESQSQQHLQSMQRIMETALQSQRDTSVAAAHSARPHVVAPASTASAHCPQCGNALPQSAKFCGKCGNSMN